MTATWEVVERAPPAALGPHVLGYCGYAERSGLPVRRLEVPTPEVHVIVTLGPSIRVPERLTSFVAAPDTTHTVVEHDGEQHGVELRLTPLGTRMVFGVPMHELAHRTVGLEDLLGREAGALEERLAGAPGWAERFALLDDVLARRLARAAPPAPAVEHAWRRLVRTHGGAAIGELAQEVGWSRRHLAARFRDEVGLPPKVYARVLRFTWARTLLGRPGGPSLCEVALACGYCDQAHLNRDFRAFAGCTPTELVAHREEVAFVQDAAAGAA